MTVEKVVEDPKGNPPDPNAGQPPAKNDPNPPKLAEGVPNPNDELIKKLTEENETYKRQYKGSSEEAIRLKKENDSLAKKLEVSHSSQSVSNTFQELVEQGDLAGAIQSVVQPLVDKVERLYDEKATATLSGFQSMHPGLKGEVLTAWTAKFNQVRSTYTNLDEAMSDAYRLVGGMEADAVVKNAAAAAEAANADQSQSNQNQNQAVDQVIDAGGDKKPNPDKPASEIRAKIELLKQEAIVREINGQRAIELYAKIEDLKRDLAQGKV